MLKILNVVILSLALALPAYHALAQNAGNGNMSAGDQGASRQSAQLSRSTIRRIQARLRKDGYNPGGVDGIWGRHTARAMRNFQRSKGLTSTGRADAGTLQALGVSYTNTGNGNGSSGSGSAGNSGTGYGNTDNGSNGNGSGGSNAGGSETNGANSGMNGSDTGGAGPSGNTGNTGNANGGQ